jgi:hypothetical protein
MSYARFGALSRGCGCGGACGGGRPATPPTPLGLGQAPSPCVHRFEIARLPLLAAHRTPDVPPSEPDLIVRANRHAAEMDVVVHFHGYSGRGRGMRLARDKEPHSGLDFCNPDRPAEPGRARPTIGLLPRGRYFGGRSGMGYHFPALTRPGQLTTLIQLGLAEAARRSGIPQIRPGRLILTGHSGGGAPLLQLLPMLEGAPDEVHIFDGLYGAPPNLIRWMSARVTRDAGAVRGLAGQGRANAIPGYMRARGGALRVIFRCDGPRSTEASSQAVASALERLIKQAPDAASAIRPYYRVEQTSVGHNGIPRAFGFRLLADAAADVPRARSIPPMCRPPATRVAGF